jgi:hypothetical protein
LIIVKKEVSVRDTTMMTDIKVSIDVRVRKGPGEWTDFNLIQGQ